MLYSFCYKSLHENGTFSVLKKLEPPWHCYLGYSVIVQLSLRMGTTYAIRNDD